MKINKHKIFTVSKTDSQFLEVTFSYENGNIWNGCFPIYYPQALLQFESEELIDKGLEDAYISMSPNKIQESLDKTKNSWSRARGTETHIVFEALVTGKWECRTCGVGKINDQPPARIRDIKKFGYIIATKIKPCSQCNKNSYQDLLLPFSVSVDNRSEFRKPLSTKQKEKIIETLKNVDIFFDSVRPNNDFVIDHKFPSQRWVKEESDNSNLNDDEIKRKFQLLTNQTNMLKSRLCDRCVTTGTRPSFLGIKWYYSGGENWEAVELGNDESGCYGCPWYDLKEWKAQVVNKLATKL